MHKAENKRPAGGPAEKLKSRRGVAWLVGILAAAVIVMAVICLIPSYQKYQKQGKTLACAVALDSARRRIATDFMFDGFQNSDAEQAKKTIERAMLGWEDLCPDGGSVYIIPIEGEVAWDVVCGMHDKDSRRRTRLNASNVRDQLVETLLKERKKGNPYPESLPYSLHHREGTAFLVDEPTNFKRGTKTTMGMENEGTVVYYSIVGHSDFGADSGLREGELWYFSFADEEHCATWQSNDGWTGDSYRGIS